MATEKDGCKFVYLSDKNPRIVEMKPGVYHGYKALEPNSILLYYLTEKYNTDDEIRAKVGHFGEDWGVPNK
jgi:dTDP-4-dehydrorhamnose 3,5-epimerase-like enzyme